MATYEYPIKCLSCGLHYTVWSWDEKWTSKHDPHCPECGTQRALGFGSKQHETQIFEHVPGEIPVTVVNYS